MLIQVLANLACRSKVQMRLYGPRPERFSRSGLGYKVRLFGRRNFIKVLLASLVSFAFETKIGAKSPYVKERASPSTATIFRSVNGNPSENMVKVIDLMGGIGAIIGENDLVVVKPNVQWWNQGVPNLSAVRTFVDLIMNRPAGYRGEVVLAENCHRGPTPYNSKSSGWIRAYDRNADSPEITNYNSLCNVLKTKYEDRFSVCHWVDVDAGGKKIFGPADGAGYIYCDGTGETQLIPYDNGTAGKGFRQTIMTYPVFRTDRGTLVDFKEGIWTQGKYEKQRLKIINFAALNHHSAYCGVTSAIENYLGVVDLSGGADPYDDGKLAGGYYNFHSFPFDKWGPGPKPGMLGAAVAVFMNTIRRADLNIVTADWVGLASRTEPPVARTQVLLACTDPVALDYHSSKYVLHPNSSIKYHDPDDSQSPTHQYLKECSKRGGGILDERKVDVKSYDFRTGRFQDDDELFVIGAKEWGLNPKSLIKYLLYRFGHFLI